MLALWIAVSVVALLAVIAVSKPSHSESVDSLEREVFGVRAMWESGSYRGLTDRIAEVERQLSRTQPKPPEAPKPPTLADRLAAVEAERKG